MNVYEVVNKSGRGAWILADGDEDAKRVFMLLFPRSKISTTKLVTFTKRDFENFDEASLQVLLNGKDKGQLGAEVKSYSFADVLSGLAANDKTKSRWKLMKKVEA